MTEPLFAKLRQLYQEANPHGISVWSSDAELNKDAVLMMAALNCLPRLFAALDLMQSELNEIAEDALAKVREIAQSEDNGCQHKKWDYTADKCLDCGAMDPLAKLREMGK